MSCNSQDSMHCAGITTELRKSFELQTLLQVICPNTHPVSLSPLKHYMVPPLISQNISPYIPKKTYQTLEHMQLGCDCPTVLDQCCIGVKSAMIACSLFNPESNEYMVGGFYV